MSWNALEGADTRQSVRVLVTQAHIDKGDIGQCERCPVALAISDALPSLIYISVDGEEAKFVLAQPEGQTSYDALFDARVKGKIDDYDYNSEMKPFEFTLKYRRSGDR